jgi:hypothetical protein
MTSSNWDFTPGVPCNEEYTRFSVVARVPFPLGGHVIAVRCKNLADGWDNEGTAMILGPAGGKALGKAQSAFGFGSKGNIAFLPDNDALQGARGYFNSRVGPEDRIIAAFESVEGSIDGEIFGKALQDRRWIVAKSGPYMFHDTWDHAPALFFLPSRIWLEMFGVMLEGDYDPKFDDDTRAARVARQVDIITERLTIVLGTHGDQSWGTQPLQEMVDSPNAYQEIQKRVQQLEQVMPCNAADVWANKVLDWVDNIT